MKTFVALLLLTFIVACGSEYVEPSTEQPSPSVPAVVTHDEPVDAGVDSAPKTDVEDPVIVTDASTPDVDPVQCAPTIGYCLTNMATRCYETSFDDTTNCDSSGQSSGWHTGSCATGARSSGGCMIGCDVTYFYPLGGGDATDATRAVIKEQCEGSGGTYIDTTPYESDSGTY